MTEQVKGSSFEETMAVHAAPDVVFAFVADVANLPKYLPTTKQAMAQGEERVRVRGEADGHPYDADGFLRADWDAHRLAWGADERYYSGELEVRPDETDSVSLVTVRLHFSERPGGEQGPSDEEIREGLRAALRSIENYVTGEARKEEPESAS